MRITELRKKIGRTDLYIPDLHIEHGKIHGLTGPNGCGKTTLLKLIIGITQPDSGTIDLEGLRPTDITMTSQRPYLMHASVYDNIVLPLKNMKADVDKEEIMGICKRLKIDELIERKPNKLSGGEAIRVSIARSIAANKRIIVARIKCEINATLKVSLNLNSFPVPIS